MRKICAHKTQSLIRGLPLDAVWQRAALPNAYISFIGIFLVQRETDKDFAEGEIPQVKEDR